MAPADIAALRLDLARALASAGRPADALVEVEAGLAESPAPEVLGELHRTAAEALERIGQPGGALAHWLRTAAAGGGGDQGAALAALRLLEDPASAADLARRVDAETLGRFDAAGTQRAAAFATRLLHLRLHRLRDETGGDATAADSLDVPDDAPAELLRVLAAECAALGLVEDALRLLPAGDERSAALRARSLVQAGLHAEALAVPVPDDAATARSVRVSHALAHLAGGRPGEAGDLLDPYSEEEDPEPHLARVVVALQAHEYREAEAAVARAGSVAADSADVRLLRAQIPLERGEVADVGRGRQLLERLVERGGDQPVREPSWLRVQRAVRGGSAGFAFVRAQWALVSGDPRSAEDLLASIRRDGLTPAQEAAVDVELAELLASRGDGAGAAGALDRAVTSWTHLEEHGRAHEVVERARELGLRLDAATVARSRAQHAHALLEPGPQQSPGRARELAEEAWELHPDEDAAVLLADACAMSDRDDAPARWERNLLGALRALAQVPVTARSSAVRGAVLQRLAEAGSSQRRSCGRAATAWHLVANLLEPGSAPWLQNLVWSLGAVEATEPADLVARHQLSLAPEDANALWVAVAARLNLDGTDPGVEELLGRLEADDEWAEPVSACRIRTATLTGRLDELAALLAAGGGGNLPWMRSVRTDAVAVLGGPGWREALRETAVAEETAGDHLSAARHHLLRLDVPAGSRSCDLAEQAGEEPRRIDLLRRLGALVAAGPGAEGDDGRVEAEEAVLRLVDRLHAGDDLLWLAHVDVPLLLRGTSSAPSSRAALERVRRHVLERLDRARPDPAGVPTRELTQVDGSGALAALFELLLLDVDDSTEPVVLRAAAVGARTALERVDPATWPGPADVAALLPAARAAVDAVVSRHALRRLEALRLLPEGPAGAEALTGVAGWAGDLRGPGERRRALAVAALDLLLREGIPLGVAAARVGFDGPDGADAPGGGAPEPLPARLAAAWSANVPDAASWWRLDDALAAALPDHELAGVRGPLAGRLAELTTVREPQAPAGRGVQSALLGARLVPEDRSDEWVLLSEEIPALKRDVREATGVDLPGFRLRFDPVLDDAITYLVHGAVAGFTRVRPAGWIDGGPEGERDGRGGDAAVRASARVVAESFREWAVAHLPDLLVPQVLVDLLERGAPTPDGPAAALDDPARLVLALDEARAALRAGRRAEDGAGHAGDVAARPVPAGGPS